MRDYYKILGISYKATRQEIKIAYRKLVKKYHPDISQEENASEKFQLIREAYDTLGNPQKKKIYDVKLHQAKLLKELNKVRRKIRREQQKQTYEKLQKQIYEENRIAHRQGLKIAAAVLVLLAILSFVFFRYFSGSLPVTPEAELDLSYRHLKEFPESLKNSSRIYILKLDHNSFQKIPAEVTTLPNLHYLDFSYNRIQNLSEEILHLPDGIYLNLSHNKIREIPWELIKRRSNAAEITINLKGNPVVPEFKEKYFREKPRKVLLVF